MCVCVGKVVVCVCGGEYVCGCVWGGERVSSTFIIVTDLLFMGMGGGGGKGVSCELPMPPITAGESVGPAVEFESESGAGFVPLSVPGRSSFAWIS